MKTAPLPPVRVDEALRIAAEQVLGEGESRSAFIEASVRRAVGYRQVHTDFLALRSKNTAEPGASGRTGCVAMFEIQPPSQVLIRAIRHPLEDDDH